MRPTSIYLMSRPRRSTSQNLNHMIRNQSIILCSTLSSSCLFFKIRVVTVTEENFNPGLTNPFLNCFKEPNQLYENGSWETVSFYLFNQTTCQAQLMEPQLKNRLRAQVPTVSLSTCAEIGASQCYQEDLLLSTQPPIFIFSFQSNALPPTIVLPSGRSLPLITLRYIQTNTQR